MGINTGKRLDYADTKLSQAVEEAIEIANGTSYGLAAAVFGKNKARCRHVASRLECGMVAINEWVTSASLGDSH